ncbi:unnamed protein product, partial [Ectocarpus sp. 13 AM-2016]
CCVSHCGVTSERGTVTNHSGRAAGASWTGDLDMILMGMDTGTLGVARLRTGHL